MMCDPHARLVRLLTERAGPDAEMVEAVATPWTSVTFTGTRHQLSFLAGRDGADRLRAVSEEELAIPGHLVAAIETGTPCRAGPSWRIDVAALTLEWG